MSSPTLSPEENLSFEILEDLTFGVNFGVSIGANSTSSTDFDRLVLLVFCLPSLPSLLLLLSLLSRDVPFLLEELLDFLGRPELLADFRSVTSGDSIHAPGRCSELADFRSVTSGDSIHTPSQS
jgi:hypothetical protein